MPDLLDDIVGQDRQKEILNKIYNSKRIPNAFLFSGPEGVGKFYTAVRYIALLNHNKNETIRNKILHLEEPYVQIIFPLPRGRGETPKDSPTEKLSKDILEEISNELSIKSKNPYYQISLNNANNIKISSIREIKRKVSFNYDEINFRGIIINEAHKMSAEAQNALLKSLEEPPGGVIFFLLSASENMLLDTIKSRCWKVEFNPLNENEIVKILTTYFNVDESTAQKVAPFGNGSAWYSKTLLDNGFTELLNEVIILLRYSLAKRYFTAINKFESILNLNDNITFKVVIELILKWLDDILKDRNNIKNLYFTQHVETIKKFNSKFASANVYQVYTDLEKLSGSFDQNISLNIIIMNTIFKLATLTNG